MIKVRFFFTGIEIKELEFFASNESGIRRIAAAKIKEYCAENNLSYNAFMWEFKTTAPAESIGDKVVTWPIVIGTLIGLITIMSILAKCLLFQ